MKYRWVIPFSFCVLIAANPSMAETQAPERDQTEASEDAPRSTVWLEDTIDPVTGWLEEVIKPIANWLEQAVQTPSLQAQPTPDIATPRQSTAHKAVKLSPANAAAIAKQAYPGDILRTSLLDKTPPQYRVKLISAQGVIHMLYIDANTGEIMGR